MKISLADIAVGCKIKEGGQQMSPTMIRLKFDDHRFSNFILATKSILVKPPIPARYAESTWGRLPAYQNRSPYHPHLRPMRLKTGKCWNEWLDSGRENTTLRTGFRIIGDMVLSSNRGESYSSNIRSY